FITADAGNVVPERPPVPDTIAEVLTCFRAWIFSKYVKSHSCSPPFLSFSLPRSTSEAYDLYLPWVSAVAFCPRLLVLTATGLLVTAQADPGQPSGVRPST